MGPNTGLSPNTVKEGLDEVLYTQYDYKEGRGIVTADNSTFFKQRSTNKGAVQTEEFLPAGKWEEHAEEEEVRIATIRTDNKKTHTVLNYKKALKIPVEYYEDEMFDVVNKAVGTMGLRARTTRDQTVLGKFPGGFARETTSDGAYVFSASHTALSGDTIDNLETGVFNAANLEIMVRGLRRQKAQDGELGGHDANGLLVALNLYEDALEVTGSELKPGTANNDVNIFMLSSVYPSLELVGTSPFLHSDFSSATNVNTAYYVVSRNHSLNRWVRVKMDTSIVDYKYDDQDRYTYKGRYREISSWVSWEGVIGSNGTV
jgi:hypothetical protein